MSKEGLHLFVPNVPLASDPISTPFIGDQYPYTKSMPTILDCFANEGGSTPEQEKPSYATWGVEDFFAHANEYPYHHQLVHIWGNYVLVNENNGSIFPKSNDARRELEVRFNKYSQERGKNDPHFYDPPTKQ